MFRGWCIVWLFGDDCELVIFVIVENFFEDCLLVDILVDDLVKGVGILRLMFYFYFLFKEVVLLILLDWVVN